MGSTISISAPIAAGVEPAPRAQTPGGGQASDLQRAYREQCGKVLDKRDDGCDDGRDGDDVEAGRAHARKRAKRNGEPPVAAVGMPAPHSARERAIALRFGGARGGANARVAGVEAGVEAHVADGARTRVEPRDEIAPRRAATMRGHAPALGVVRATGERAPDASTADARAPQAAADVAPPSVPTQAQRAAQRTPDGIVRDTAAGASRYSAMAADAAASRSPALPAARLPAATIAAASAMSAMSAVSAASSTRRPTAAASPGAARERVDGDDSNRAGDASLAGFPRAFQPQASMRAAEPAARTHDPSRAARQRAQAGAAQTDARDVRDTQGTQVRYRFNSWDGRPAVELRFDPGCAPRVVSAQPSHERVQRAMEYGVDRLTPGWTVEFDRQRADDDGGRSPWRRARQEPEADER
ncbi:BsaU protein [Burkholderia humptydooensis]|uniref:BsaU protein n=3 Tax=Burkholderia humptydooensis TaxID=430531 RepID=A0A7U4P9F1_9BURK|nr:MULTISPECIES: hypothetical protein [Burkholderia]AJY40382.1 putative bsaU protein [Burkholderia sp. 2002721687]ALX45372.1 BsaU protein [Burkholderia humptydooensis]EIP85433.1 BsaU protein [Burkholderia humptydooensis MSMB43]QPS46844.1 BsaU protein [Burkholderia humptydooensis]